MYPRQYAIGTVKPRGRAYQCNGHYSATRKKETLPLASVWIELEGVMLSEIKLNGERQILCEFTYVGSRKTWTRRNRE